MKKLKFLYIIGSLILSINVAQAQSYTLSTSTTTLSTSTSQALPDLVVSKIELAYIPISSRVYTGSTIKFPVIVTIKNVGKATANNYHPIRTYLNRYGLTSGGVYNDFHNAIYPGQSIKLKMTMSVPLSLNGSAIKLTAVTDIPGKGVIKEYDEYTNNKKTAYLYLPTFKPSSKLYYSLK